MGRLENRFDGLEKKVDGIADAEAANAERIQGNRVLLEDLQGQVRVIAEGYEANVERIQATRTELGHQIEQVDRRLIEVDVKLSAKIDALAQRTDARFDAMDTKFDAMSTQLSRITAHLGIDESRRKRPPRGAGKRRKSSGSP